ncbi:MAG: hypothetical protein WAM14_12185 [Candidatus Nitrosopolaris sp.]
MSSPSGHSNNFCAGWEAGAQSQPTVGCGAGTDNSTCSTQSQPTVGCGAGTDNSTCNTPSQENGPNYSAKWSVLYNVVIFVFFVIDLEQCIRTSSMTLDLYVKLFNEY